jgi:hypothetical protein
MRALLPLGGLLALETGVGSGVGACRVGHELRRAFATRSAAPGVETARCTLGGWAWLARTAPPMAEAGWEEGDKLIISEIVSKAINQLFKIFESNLVVRAIIGP